MVLNLVLIFQFNLLAFLHGPKELPLKAYKP